MSGGAWGIGSTPTTQRVLGCISYGRIFQPTAAARIMRLLKHAKYGLRMTILILSSPFESLLGWLRHQRMPNAPILRTASPTSRTTCFLFDCAATLPMRPSSYRSGYLEIGRSALVLRLPQQPNRAAQHAVLTWRRPSLANPIGSHYHIGALDGAAARCSRIFGVYLGVLTLGRCRMRVLYCYWESQLFAGRGRVLLNR